MSDEKYIQVAYSAPSESEGASPSGDMEIEAIANAPRDSDGNPIPTVWQNSPNWEKHAATVRKKWSEIWCRDQRVAAQREKMEAAKPKRTGSTGTKFTTDYAIEWGRRQKCASGLGWKLVDRERYSPSWRGQADIGRYHDLMLGLDALFDDGQPGMVGIQGAGVGERKVHWERFVQRGGVETAKRRGIRVLYMEFERGNKTPVKIENWA